MGIRGFVGILLVCSGLVSQVAAEPVAVKQFAGTFLLFEQGKDGNKRLLAEPGLATIVGRPATFWSGGEVIIEGAPADPWQWGTRVDLHIYELKDDRIDVEFKLSASTSNSVKQDQDKYDELHVTGEQFRSRFKAKLGESKVIRSSSGRWLEVIFDEIDPSALVHPRRQAIEESVHSPQVEVHVRYLDRADNGATHTRALINTRFDSAQPFEVEGPQMIVRGKTEASGQIASRYRGRFHKLLDNSADVEVVMELDEVLRDETSNASPETSRRTTEHRFTFRAHSGKSKVFKIGEQQRVELTFTWE